MLGRGPACLLALALGCAGGCAARPRPGPPPPVEAATAPLPADRVGGWIRDLASEDFEVRSRAAEALVALGEPALAPLGAAGDRPVAAHGKVPVSTTRPVVTAILAKVPEDRLAALHLSSDAGLVRRGAAEELGRRDGWSGVPFLIERLEDPDPAVRIATVAALRRITNRFYDVEADAPAGVRTAAAARARTWWNEEGRLAAPARPKAPGS